MTWVPICELAVLVPGRGVCALVGDDQVAVFRVPESDDVLAVSNYDPFAKAHVVSRGIVGDRGGVVKVASPMYKHNFDLRTGRCLDDPSMGLATYPVRVNDGRVEILASP